MFCVTPLKLLTCEKALGRASNPMPMKHLKMLKQVPRMPTFLLPNSMSCTVMFNSLLSSICSTSPSWSAGGDISKSKMYVMWGRSKLAYLEWQCLAFWVPPLSVSLHIPLTTYSITTFVFKLLRRVHVSRAMVVSLWRSLSKCDVLEHTLGILSLLSTIFFFKVYSVHFNV